VNHETLRLALLPAAAVEARPPRVFARRDGEAAWGRYSLRVIGESSLVVVEWGGGALAELVTCGPAPGGRLLAGAVFSVAAGSAAGVSAAGAGFAYEARAWTEPPEPAAAGGAFPDRVEHHFPGGDSPATVIEADPSPEGLAVRTRHDYPERGVTVWTRSTWRLAAGEVVHRGGAG